MSRYQKGKTSLDLNEARDGGVLGRQWHQLDHFSCISLHVFFCLSMLKKKMTRSTNIDVGSDIVLGMRQSQGQKVMQSVRCGSACRYDHTSAYFTAVSWSVCLLVTTLSCAKVAEPIKMLVGIWTGVSPRKKGKGSPYSITERIGFRSRSRFLAVSLQVM